MRLVKNEMPRTTQQGIFWIATIKSPHPMFPPTSLPAGVKWLRGQQEIGQNGGYAHWQCCIALSKKGRLLVLTTMFGTGHHFELTRSAAAEAYVWKDDTAVEGTRFELGAKPIRVNSGEDWNKVWESAKTGDLDSIPPRIRVLSYRTIRAIASDFTTPVGMEREVYVFWGPTGTGKSRRAWEEAGVGAYSKCPRTKFWDGYQTQGNVVMDEFRGGIDVAHLLRWFDRYPVRVEIKGSTKPFWGTKIWITSNISPVEWFMKDGVGLDDATFEALNRRFTSVINLT